MIVQNLTQMILCNKAVNQTFFPYQSVNLLYSLDSGITAKQVTNPEITTGATLNYQCSNLV